jgi:uroporphyrinogen-III synthase
MRKPIYLFSTSSHPDAKSINSLDVDFSKPDIDPNDYDYFILTSKQVSKVLDFYKVQPLKPALCVSKGTAASYKKIGGEILACGKGYGDDLANIITTYPQEKKWLYLRAKEVASDFVATCQNNGYNIDENIIYETKCSNAIQYAKIEENSILIFTSPSSVKCFLEHHEIPLHAKTIVIGKTTAKALPTGIEAYMPKERSIESCMELAKQLF